MTIRNKIFACAVALAVSTSAFATVTFNSTTGRGFVGKGDVQLAFNWNNAQLQKNAAGVAFTYNAVTTCSAVCTFVTGSGTPGQQTHNVSLTRKSSVIGSIAYDARVRTQIGIARNGAWSAVSDRTVTGGGLYVNYGADSVQIGI